MKVLNSCFNSSLTYGCETWSYGSLASVSTLHRKAIKMVLGIRNSTPNNIVLVESGIDPIQHSIISQQLKFWQKTKIYARENPDSPIANVLNLAHINKIRYIVYYEKLENKYKDSKTCHTTLNNDYFTKTINSMYKTTDNDTPIGTYIQVNPKLETPKWTHSLLESERMIITKYRMGSHHLKIETGRWSRKNREDRLCDKCDTQSIQNLNHVLFVCPYTRGFHFDGTIPEFFNSDNCIDVLKFFDHCFKL